ncbi:hypothetical protein G7054_g8449 [Neopestalotiopsis clavispora]|nr:hypothetical protein G7054_g8449 [Neopestalotiopsis clavispora]
MKSFVLALPAVMAAATPLKNHKECRQSNSTPAFVLTGDSTTAVQSSGGGGWGNGFLSFLKSPAWGVNLGHNGATTVSFVNGGDWATAMGDVDDKTADGYDVYVTIQFGHNDQKAAANITLDEYQANLENLAQDRIYTIAAAEATDTTYLDLNKYSLEYVDAIGNTSAQAYDLNGYGADTTHLNAYGSIVFGRLVADLLLEKLPELDSWFTPNETLSYDLANGIAA